MGIRGAGAGAGLMGIPGAGTRLMGIPGLVQDLSMSTEEIGGLTGSGLYGRITERTLDSVVQNMLPSLGGAPAQFQFFFPWGVGQAGPKGNDALEPRSAAGTVV